MTVRPVRRLQEKRGWAFNVAVPILKPTLLATTKRTWIDGEKIPAQEWESRQGDWLPTDVDKTYVRSLMQPVHQRGKIAAWIAPPRNGINGQPFDYDYVHLA